MGKVCLQCGDIGFKKELVYCFKCMKASRHRYCMDFLPKTKHGLIRWLCDECRESSDKKKSMKRKRQKVVSDSDHDEDEEVMIFIKRSNRTRKNQEEAAAHDDDDKSVVIYAAEPLIRSVWTGIFDIFQDESNYIRMDGCFHAFLSTKASHKVFHVAAQFEHVIQFEMLPRFYVWPDSFEVSGPRDDNIGLYFFPSLTNQENYHRLVYEMIRDDLAMRSFEDNAELLIFASTMLPSRFWRFQGKLYLWGVFMRGNQGPLQ